MTPTISPCGSNSICGSGRSKSIEPRLHALAIELHRELFHQLEALHQRRIALAQSRVAFEQQMHVGVRHPLDAANHSAREVLADHIARVVDLQDAPTSPGGPLAASASTTRSTARQAASAPRDRGSRRWFRACNAFAIDRRARPDVVAHVGDMDVQRRSCRSAAGPPIRRHRSRAPFRRRS